MNSFTGSALAQRHDVRLGSALARDAEQHYDTEDTKRAHPYLEG